jgi:acyl-CoA thioester hydrolase
MAALEQSINYKSELRAGDMFEIRSQILEINCKTIRARHDMHKTRDGVLAASTTILGVHLDALARKSLPLPATVRERAQSLTFSNYRVSAFLSNGL